MHTKKFIAVNEFCTRHDIDITFISALHQHGLIELTTTREISFIAAEQLHQIEKFINFHYGMDINMEGIETISWLLNRMDLMHDEITALRNRLRLYESD